jgi:hypothetical protein
MDILDSLELRWFLPADTAVTAQLQNWFSATEDEGQRVDHYLALGRPDLSFKARLTDRQPAKLEAKYLVGSLGNVRVAAAMCGELQRWSKLSLAHEDAKLQQHGTWLALQKKRQLRKFSVDLGGTSTTKEVATSDHPQAGCGVELTRLEYTIDDVRSVEWTFGFEAFGPVARLLGVLQAAVHAATAQRGLPPLGAERTASYASWLMSKVPSHSDDAP